MGLILPHYRRPQMPVTPTPINFRAPVAEGLVAWWPLYDVRRNPRDYRNRHVFTVQNDEVGFTTDNLDFGRVMNGNGVSGRYASCPDHPQLRLTDFPRFTISCWGRATDVTVAQRFVHKETSNLLVAVVSSGLWFEVSGVGVANGGTMVNDTWHHMVGVYDGTDVIGYLDAVEVDRETGTPNADAQNEWRLFGRSGQYLNGRIAEVAMWNRALSAEEVRGLYVPATRWQLHPTRRYYLAYHGLSGTPVEQTSSSRYETLQQVSASTPTRVEALNQLTRELVTAIESNEAVANSLASLYETVEEVAQSSATPIESQQSISAVAASRYESLSRIVQLIQSPYETMALIQALRATRIETQTSLMGTITLDIDVSNTTGSIPLPVHVDCTATTTTTSGVRPFHELYYVVEKGTSDGDFYPMAVGGRSRELTVGPIAHFVYDNPGTFQLRVTAIEIDLVTGAIVDTATDTVEITPASRESVYSTAETFVVHNTGQDLSGAPAHDPGNETTTADAADIRALIAAAPAGGRRIAMRADSVYSGNLGQVGDNVLIEMYGTGAQPLYNYTSGQFVGCEGSDGVRVVDQHCDGGTTGGTGFIDISTTSTDCLFYRCHIANGDGNSIRHDPSGTPSDYLAFVECTSEFPGGMDSIAMFVAHVDHFAVVGTDWSHPGNRSDPPEPHPHPWPQHAFRCGGMRFSVIANTRFYGNATATGGMAIRGWAPDFAVDPRATEHNCITHVTIDGGPFHEDPDDHPAGPPFFDAHGNPIEFTQNPDDNRHHHDCLVDGLYVTRMPMGATTEISARNVTIRNSVWDTSWSYNGWSLVMQLVTNGLGEDVDDATPTTTQVEATVTGNLRAGAGDDDFYNGWSLWFTEGPAANEIVTVTDYEVLVADTQVRFTFDALSIAPNNGDRFEVMHVPITGTRIYNCTGYSDTRDISPLVSAGQAVQDTVVRNCVACSTGGSANVVSDSAPPGETVASNNTATTDYVSNFDGTISGDHRNSPMSLEDFDLLGSSALVDGGFPVPVIRDKDLNTRPETPGGDWDQGAHEFTPGGTPVQQTGQTAYEAIGRVEQEVASAYESQSEAVAQEVASAIEALAQVELEEASQIESLTSILQEGESPYEALAGVESALSTAYESDGLSGVQVILIDERGTLPTLLSESGGLPTLLTE